MWSSLPCTFCELCIVVNCLFFSDGSSYLQCIAWFPSTTDVMVPNTGRVSVFEYCTAAVSSLSLQATSRIWSATYALDTKWRRRDCFCYQWWELAWFLVQYTQQENPTSVDSTANSTANSTAWNYNWENITSMQPVRLHMYTHCDWASVELLPVRVNLDGHKQQCSNIAVFLLCFRVQSSRVIWQPSRILPSHVWVLTGTR